MFLISDGQKRFNTCKLSPPNIGATEAARLRDLAIKMINTEAAILMNDLADDHERVAYPSVVPATQ